MSKKNLYSILGVTGVLTLSLVCAFAFTGGINNPINTFAEAKTIHYHCADDASKGSVSDETYTVTEEATGYYYTAYVSEGTFSSDGLALTASNYFNADLKGANSTQLIFSSGVFAVELSNDGTNYSRAKYVASTDTYSFHTLMRFVKVTCIEAGTLTDINIGCECSEDYVLDTAPAMSESVWTNEVKQNRLTLVGQQKGSNMDDLNYHNIVASRDNHGIYFYVTEKISGSYYSTGNTDWKGQWFGKDNFEVHFNSVNEWTGGNMLYTSLEPTDCGNFDVVSIKTHDRYQGYDCFLTATFKCFASYEKLNELSGGTYDSLSSIYLWYGSRCNDAKFDSVSFWGNASEVKLTTSGIVDTSDNLYGTIANREGSWGTTENWYKVTDDLTENTYKTLATHVEGSQGYSGDNWGDYCWRGPLSILPENGNLGTRTVFRFDWFGWSDGYTPDASNNGASWAPEEAKATSGKTQFYETVIDCEVVYVFSYNSSNHEYTSLRIIFPNNPDVVTRGDFLLFQRVTTEKTLGAYINAEFTNSVIYK